MSSLSRRRFLATVVAGTAGATAGCSGFSSGGQSPGSPPPALKGTSIFVADGVDFPDVDGVESADDPAAADVALFAAGADVERVRSTLDGGTISTVVGDDAQVTVSAACDATGQSYGFCRDSWGPGPHVVAAVPHADVIATHTFPGLAVPDDLPWALDEVISGAGPECLALRQSTAVPAPVDDATPVGVSRIRSRNDAGEFDRWGRVRAVPVTDSDRVGIVVDMKASIRGGESGYAADQIRLVAQFDQRLGGQGVAAGIPTTLDIRDWSHPEQSAVEHSFTPSDDAERPFAACQRAFVTTTELDSPFSYTANGRFRWRNAGLLDDEMWYHHTPGRAVWHPSCAAIERVQR